MALVVDAPEPGAPSLRARDPRLSPAVEAVVLQALRKESEQRPTAEEFARNLSRAVGQGGGREAGSASQVAGSSEAVTRVAVIRPRGPPPPQPFRTTSPRPASLVANRPPTRSQRAEREV